MKKKTFLFLFALLGVCLCISAQSLEELTGHAQANALRTGEAPILVQSRNPRPQLFPAHQFSKELIETILLDFEPSILVETLHIYKKPSAAASWSGDEKAGLYNNLLALSTLAGLEYFSISRGAIRTFYESSTVIDNAIAGNPIPDPFFLQPQERLTIFARQRDTTFGDNIYQYDYYAVPGGIFFVQQNITPLRLGIITAVAANNLRSAVAVLDAGEYILIYAASMARTAGFPGLRERIGSSFANRAEAILNWFTGQADKVFLGNQGPGSQFPSPSPSL